MQSYLMVQNLGVCPSSLFTLLGASTTKSSELKSAVGFFGSGTKFGLLTCMRAGITPIIFCGNLKLDFSVRDQKIDDGIRRSTFQRVVVKYSGRDEQGVSRSNQEEAGFCLDYGTRDWGEDINLALREFISNSLDRSYEEALVEITKNEHPDDVDFAVADARPWEDVTIEVVSENQVRA